MSAIEKIARQSSSENLALFGGVPAVHDSFPGWPHFEREDIEAVSEVLRSGKVNYWTGPHGKAFEEEFAAYCGRQYGVAVANGTVSIELALLAFNIGTGAEVVCPPRTFIASASAVVARGAIPIMADVDRTSQNITAETIERVLTPKTRAIIVVHLAGWPCDMDPIMELAAQHNLIVIEDCAQAHGARYKGKPVGALGHVASFSFCQDKILTTGGEGGMLLMDDRNIWKAAWAYKDHGKDYDTVFNTDHPPGFRWLHDSFGTNWRITELQAVLGREWLKKLDLWVEIRRSHAQMLQECVAKWDCLRPTLPPTDVYHSYYRFYVFVRPDRLADGWDRDLIMNAVAAEGVPCFSGSCSEIYLEKAFSTIHCQPEERLPVAQELGETSLCFLVHPTLSSQHVASMCTALEKVLKVAQRSS